MKNKADTQPIVAKSPEFPRIYLISQFLRPTNEPTNRESLLNKGLGTRLYTQIVVSNDEIGTWRNVHSFSKRQIE